jgi:hypothetical protein
MKRIVLNFDKNRIFFLILKLLNHFLEKIDIFRPHYFNVLYLKELLQMILCCYVADYCCHSFYKNSKMIQQSDRFLK